MLRVQTAVGGTQAISLQDGLTGTEMGDWLLTAVAQHGLTDNVARAKFESDQVRVYEAKEAEGFLTAVTQVQRIFNDHRNTLTGNLRPHSTVAPQLRPVHRMVWYTHRCC